MRQFMQPPKSARIKCYIWDDLIIENHQILNDDGLLDWMGAIFVCKEWNEIVPQLISRGFKFNAFVEWCIRELTDTKKFAVFMSYYVSSDDIRDRMYQFKDTQEGKATIKRIITLFFSCKNWNDLYETFHEFGVFGCHIEKEIQDMLYMQYISWIENKKVGFL